MAIIGFYVLEVIPFQFILVLVFELYMLFEYTSGLVWQIIF